MHEVTKKIDELLTMLEDKNKAQEALNAQISSRKAVLDEVERKQSAAANNLAARERLVGKLEDLSKGQADLSEKFKAYAEDKVKLEKAKEEVSAKDKKTEEALKQALDSKAYYEKKLAALEAEKETMAKEKAIRAKILDEIRKGI